jgi:hypothetical protein
MAGWTIQTHGLAELRRDLVALDRALGKDLGEANQQAAEIVANEARKRAVRGPHQGGGSVAPLASTITASRAQRRGVVLAGGPRSPHFPPIEFGGTIRRFHSGKRTRVAKRAALFPALAAKRGEVIVVYARLISALYRKAFPG